MQYEVFCVWLLPLCLLVLIHPQFCLSVVVLFIAGSVLCCMGELHYVYSFSSCWTLGCSQFSAIININKIAVNTHVKKERNLHG